MVILIYKKSYRITVPLSDAYRIHFIVFLFGSADLFGVGLVSELKNDCLVTVSYPHLTLPTNREV